jgi:hypothetical protein
VGFIAEATGLRGAMVAVALLAAVFAVLAPAVARGSARTGVHDTTRSRSDA